MLPQIAHKVNNFPHTAQLSYLWKVVTGKALPAPLVLVIQGRRGHVGIRVRSLMLPQVAHRGEVFSAQGATHLPLEGCGGQNPSRTTPTCDPGAEGARWDLCAFADASAGCSQRVKYFPHRAQLSYLQKVVAGKTLPAPLALVIQGWRRRVGICVGSLMLPQVAHRGEVLPAQGAQVGLEA
jgi:hypothetical protein